MRRRIHACHVRRRIHACRGCGGGSSAARRICRIYTLISHEEEDACMPYEEEDTCLSEVVPRVI